MIWCVGLAFSLIASGQAGYAISYGLGQGATMIAVIWESSSGENLPVRQPEPINCC